MPRNARKISESGYYHIFLRGNNKLPIFYDKEDYSKFFSVLRQYREPCGYNIIAWCLMGNHIHLAIQEGRESISQAMQKIEVSFVYWYNFKYNRVGHLFQNRFGSEPVEDENYLLKLVRYIHMNPVRAGICKHPAEYRYCSYFYYMSGKYPINNIIFDLISKDEFEKFHFEENDDKFMDMSNDKTQRITDEEFSRIVRQSFGYDRLTDIKYLPFDQRKQVIQFLRKAGASIRQISRLTGISISDVRIAGS